MKVIKIVNEEFDPDFDSNDYEDIKQEDVDFGEEVFGLIQGLIDNEESLTEEFVSEKALNTHYNLHCMGSYKNRVSSHNTVYYDFKDLNQYREYEEKVSKGVLSTQNIVSSLFDSEVLYKSFRNLFKGNYSIYFTTSCGFSNNKGPVSIGLNSFASDKTTNYSHNTINIIVFGGSKTITLYPIDAHYLETKFNNMLKRHSTKDVSVQYNND